MNHLKDHEKANVSDSILSEEEQNIYEEPVSIKFCEWCSKYFSNLHGLKKHRENVHGEGENGGETIKCEFCEGKFSFHSRISYFRIGLNVCSLFISDFGKDYFGENIFSSEFIFSVTKLLHQ